MTNSTVGQIHKILESLKRYSDHELIQQILNESFKNEDKSSSRAFQTSLTRDLNDQTIPPTSSKVDETV